MFFFKIHDQSHLVSREPDLVDRNRQPDLGQARAAKVCCVELRTLLIVTISPNMSASFEEGEKERPKDQIRAVDWNKPRSQEGAGKVPFERSSEADRYMSTVFEVIEKEQAREDRIRAVD